MCIPHTIYKQRRRRDGTSGRQIIIKKQQDVFCGLRLL